MKPNDVIESYITDVALQLPRKQRNDVAFELRALLQEELHAKAEDMGRAADAAMIMELLQDFGHPNDVAARYRPTLTIIDPSDGGKFLRLTLIGLIVIWSIGLLINLNQQINSSVDFLRVLSKWWGGTVIPSFWWPGVLVVHYGLVSWARQRRPHAVKWKPYDQDQIGGGRIGIAFGLTGMLCGIYLLIEPRWILDVIWNGKAAPAAYMALTYTDTFLQGLAPYLLTLVILNIPFYFALMLQGRWTKFMRRIETGFSLLSCAVMLMVVANGPIFMSSASDQTAKFILGLLVAFILVTMLVQTIRRVKPQPKFVE
ncbi:hypothetical protein [Undibacterium baiyunense]|uniref:Uncharacterized protein n=1 Tax=Undibacterium baiyunense TaxID=2828731 RepID=A0A941I2Q6_9BURK|nr:hypothetical protein [Undibacterium baiyunense]MBR7746572.1 hypothetical protein [Undibacterium baiyunense]